MTTNATIKRQKALIAEVHTLLYENIQLLKHIHPTTKELDVVCKPDMFVKNNKDAFQHVIYYLLKIYNPRTIKKYLPSWPILSNKMELEFRKEVCTYLNLLKDKNPEFDIKTIVASQLVNPGGPKFAEYMASISQLVTFKVLEKQASRTVLYPPKCNPKRPEQSKIMANHLQKVTHEIEVNNAEKLREYYKKVDGYTNKAKDVTQELHDSKSTIASFKQEMGKFKSEFIDNTRIFEEITADIEVNRNISQKIQHCSWIFQYYDSNDCYLEAEEKILNQSSSGKLSLLDYCKMFEKWTARKIYDVRYVNPTVTDQKVDLLNGNIEQCLRLLQKCADIQSGQDNFLRQLKCLNVTETTNEISTEITTETTTITECHVEDVPNVLKILIT